eukprot:jgi/Mesvir1/3743/Mv15019-RA.1
MQVNEEQALLRQYSVALQDIGNGNSALDEGSTKQLVWSLFKTGWAWYKLDKNEIAESFLARATELLSKDSGLPGRSQKTIATEIDVLECRAAVAWVLRQRPLACSLLGRALTLVDELAGGPKFDKTMQLSVRYYGLGKSLLTGEDTPGADADHSESIPLLEQAYELAASQLAPGGAGPEMTDSWLEWVREHLQRVLIHLADAHLRRGRHESAMRVLSKLGTLQLKPHPAAMLMSLKAYANMGRLQEAEGTLAQLCSKEVLSAHAATVTKWLLDAVTLLVSSFGVRALPCLRQLAEQPGVGEQPDIVLALLEQACGGPAADASFACAIAGSDARVRALKAASGTDKERFQGRDKDGEGRDKEQGGDKNRDYVARAHGLLWNFAVDEFQGKRFESAVKLFQLSYPLLGVEGEAGKDGRGIVGGRSEDLGGGSTADMRSKTFRNIALCQMAVNKLQDADLAVRTAQEIQPQPVNAFYGIKIALMKKDVGEAEAWLQQMRAAPGKDATMVSELHSFYALAAHEAMLMDQRPLAIRALSLLSASRCPSDPPESLLFRTLIKLKLEVDKDRGWAAVGKDFEQARERLLLQGVAFTGEETGDAALAELRYFADTAVACGDKAGSAGEFDPSALFFGCGADFYEAVARISDKKQEALIHSGVCLLKATSAILESMDKQANKTPSVERASSFLDRIQKLLQAHSTTLGFDKCELLERHARLLRFPLAAMAHDAELARATFQALLASGTLTPKELLRLAKCCQGMPEASMLGAGGKNTNLNTNTASINSTAQPVSNRDMALLAYRKALSLLLAQGSGEWDVVGHVVREMLSLMLEQASVRDADRNGAAVLEFLTEVSQIITVGKFPDVEIDWLVAVTWNHGALLAKFDKLNEASLFMNKAVELLSKMDPAAKHEQKQRMLAYLGDVLEAKKELKEE